MLKGEGIERTEEQCQEYIDRFFRVRPRVKRWIDMVEASTADDAISRSLFGRHRRLEEVRSSIRGVVSRALRQAVNHVVQSSASDMTLTSLTLMDQEMCVRRGDDPAMLYPTLPRREFPVDERWRRAHICLTVYDSILVDAHHSVAGDVVALMQRTMPHIVDLAHLVWGDEIAANLNCLRKVPIVADVDLGPSYRDKAPVEGPEGVAHAYRVGCYKRQLFDRDPKTKWRKDMAKDAPEVAWHG
jgi:DNA polymerase I-like protein with 3'-5' exonuclease and polymerase domains